MIINKKVKYPIKKRLFRALAIASVVFLGFLGYLFLTDTQSSNTEEYPTVDNNDSSDQPANSDSPPPDNNEPQTDNSIKNDNPDGTDTTPTTANITITASSQNGSVYQVRTLISIVAREGTCTLTMTRGTETVTNSSGVQAGPSSSTCQGFDVPVEELSPGNWEITIGFSNQTYQVKTSRMVTIE